MLFSLKAFPLALDDIQLAFEMGYPDGISMYIYIIRMKHTLNVWNSWICRLIHILMYIYFIRMKHIFLMHHPGFKLITEFWTIDLAYKLYDRKAKCMLPFKRMKEVKRYWNTLKSVNLSLLKIPSSSWISSSYTLYVFRLRQHTSLLWSIWTKPRSSIKTKS